MALFSSRRKQAIDEKREPIEVDENKIPKININNKKMKDFVLKAIGGIQRQSDARERFQRPEYNLWEIKEASESDSYVKYHSVNILILFIKQELILKVKMKECHI